MAREWIKLLYVMVSNAIRHFYVSSMGANSPIELFLLTSHFFQTQFLFVLISSESRLTLVIESDSLDLIFMEFFSILLPKACQNKRSHFWDNLSGFIINS